MNPFRAPSRLDGAWHKVGLASGFPDLDVDYDGRRITAKCKAFRIPNSKTDGSQQSHCPIEADIDVPGDLKDQVLVFKYKGKFHAIDHVSETSTDTQVLRIKLTLPAMPSLVFPTVTGEPLRH